MGYRFISQSNQIESDLQWQEFFDNLSWSKGSKTYSTVLRSLSLKDQKIKVYKAHVVGLDVKLFFSCISKHSEDFYSCIDLVESEDEILVVSYSELELVEDFSTGE